MKIRMLHNSIRFRLKQPEVYLFRQTGTISELLEFGIGEEDQLRFSLQVTQHASLRISFQQHTITLQVPREVADHWTGSDSVGFDGSIDTGKGRVMHILVEKDFQCLDGREDDNEGSYPNPMEAC